MANAARELGPSPATNWQRPNRLVRAKLPGYGLIAAMAAGVAALVTVLATGLREVIGWLS